MDLHGVETVFGVLERASVEYLVVGGLAVNAHGYVRMTMDVDLVIGLQPDNVIRGLRALLEVGYHTAVPVTPAEFGDSENRRRWQAEKGMRVLKLWSDQHPLTPVDGFVEEPFDFPTEYASAVRFPLGEGLEVPVVRLETLLEMKRAAGRPQDLADLDALQPPGATP